MMTLPANPDVIVVGAGAAGLSAAQSLRQAGYEAVVLEVADYIGGRCVTDTTTFSVPFDRGGSWLHSAPINPLAKLVEQSGTLLHKKPWEPSWVHSLGHKLSNEQVEAYQDYQDEMWDAINGAGAQTVDNALTIEKASKLRCIFATICCGFSRKEECGTFGSSIR